MAIYKTTEQMEAMIEDAHKFFELREQFIKKHDVDIAENDTANSILLYENIKPYDGSFQVNFSRNGEDAKTSGINDIEAKTRTNTKRKKCGTYSNTTFDFHAMGDLKHDSFIFTCRDKLTGKPYKIYDIREPKNVSAIVKELTRLSDEWYEKAKISKTKYDVIKISEDFILENIQLSETINKNGVRILTDFSDNVSWINGKKINIFEDA